MLADIQYNPPSVRLQQLCVAAALLATLIDD